MPLGILTWWRPLTEVQTEHQLSDSECGMVVVGARPAGLNVKKKKTGIFPHNRLWGLQKMVRKKKENIQWATVLWKWLVDDLPEVRAKWLDSFELTGRWLKQLLITTNVCRSASLNTQCSKPSRRSITAAEDYTGAMKLDNRKLEKHCLVRGVSSATFRSQGYSLA